MDRFMEAAVAEARESERNGGQAFGSVLVRNKEIIGRGRNRVFQLGEMARHAEIEAICDAGLQQTFDDTVIYATALPCEMCAGAIVHLGIPKVIIGFSGLKGNTLEYMRSFDINIVELHSDQCSKLLINSCKRFPNRYPPSARPISE